MVGVMVLKLIFETVLVKMSALEDLLFEKILAAGLPEPKKEFIFHDIRKWRFDFAFPEQLTAVEVEGGIYTGGRHTTPEGFINDCDKYNTAQLIGWVVLRFTRKHIESPAAISNIYLALNNFIDDSIIIKNNSLNNQSNLKSNNLINNVNLRSKLNE